MSSSRHHHAIVLDGPGGPDRLMWREVRTPDPPPREVLVEVTVAGVNFMDTGTRTGQNGPGPFPLTPGVEGAGRILELGEGIDEVEVGQRVAWRFAWGSYAERVNVAVGQLVPLPDDISDEDAATVLLQGLSAQHFVDGFARVKQHDTVLVHAAAGGVGLLITQMAKARGARVIGRVSSADKVSAAAAAGADEVVVARGAGFVEEVHALTGGDGVDVVFDGSGAATFNDSISTLKVHGVMAFYGPAIDRTPPVELTSLPRSILIGYPTVDDWVRTRPALLAHAAELFELVRSNRLALSIGSRYPMAKASEAHVDLHSRRTTGKLLLEAR